LSEALYKHLELLEQSGRSSVLQGIMHGIEKEGLRVTESGALSQSEHPSALGSALTHPHITTDYSEALLEFITPVFTDSRDALGFLSDLHRFSYQKLDQELIWSGSMPGFIPDEGAIPIARYGSSNVGQMKHIYRVGLKYRYGKMMQTIAGIHYNFSMPDKFWQAYQELQQNKDDLQTFRSEAYFGLIRNFRRFGWILLYLFGASPALCSSFLQGRDIPLERHDDETFFLPHATSLRMSDLGYSNKTQSSLDICFNHLNSYTDSLAKAINTPYQPYSDLGIKVDGSYRQLNGNILQIENEYYSDIRPKRVTHSGEKPIQALQRRGIEYIEVRNTDINPFLPVGIDQQQADFMDAFLVTCLLRSSPVIDADECRTTNENIQQVVSRGREPGLQLIDGTQQRSLTEWGNEILQHVTATAKVMDNHLGQRYQDAVKAQQQKLEDSALTPSAQVLATLQQQQCSYNEFMLQQSRQHRAQLLAESMPGQQQEYLDKQVQESLQQQQAVETADNISFDEYLSNYLAQ